MGFESRRSSKPHVCKTPRWRWLPLVIWPRWGEGALWRCHVVTEDGRYINNGQYCGQLWRFTWVGFYDPELAWEEVDE